METKIVKLGINGEGIGYYQKKPVFLPGALPEETVEFRIVNKQPRYLEGKVERIVKKSPYRIRPVCPHQGRCDGCPLMVLNESEQRKLKQENFIQTLQKYANVSERVMEPMIENPKPLAYRNQCKLPVVMEKGKLVNALYMQNSNYTVPIKTCYVQETGLESMRQAILDVLNAYHIPAYDHSKKKGIRHLVIRGLDGQYQCTLVTGEDYFPESLSEDLMKIKGLKSLYQSIQTTKNTPNIFGKKMIHLGGAKYIEFRLDEIVMRLSVQSFFQLNTTQAKTMYRLVKEMVPMNCDWILEGYSGIGGISLYLKDHAKEITGVEYIESAVRNANENAKRNHADHVHFVAGDAAEVMTRMLKKRTPDVIVVDPPRAGLDDAMLETLLRSKAKRIIYISCNPSTLAKNLAVLQNRYQVKRMVPLDMFSQTQHVESITLLQRK